MLSRLVHANRGFSTCVVLFSDNSVTVDDYIFSTVEGNDIEVIFLHKINASAPTAVTPGRI